MTENDELTARKMHQLLEERWPDTNVSSKTCEKTPWLGGKSPKVQPARARGE